MMELLQCTRDFTVHETLLVYDGFGVPPRGRRDVPESVSVPVSRRQEVPLPTRVCGPRDRTYRLESVRDLRDSESKSLRPFTSVSVKGVSTLRRTIVVLSRP